MLRDLDSRHAAAPNPEQALRSDMFMGALLAPAPTSGLQAAWRWPVGLAMLLLCSAVAWHFYKSAAAPRKAEQPQAVMAVSAPPPSALPWVAPLAHVPAAVAPPQLPVQHAKPVPDSMGSALAPRLGAVPKPESPASVPAAARVAPQSPAPAAPAVPAAPAAAAVPRRLAALELLSHAQNLWRLGSRDAAIELLRETLVVAEQDNGAATGKSPVLVPLARELARMQLAEGQINESLALLKRLEPALSGAADVWALRGNAEQRLGHYEESTAAYLQALKLRPNEPRWMLATAVSLAAQGHIATATELAEKARAAGVLSPEVTAYLKQLGVNLPER